VKIKNWTKRQSYDKRVHHQWQHDENDNIVEITTKPSLKDKMDKYHATLKPAGVLKDNIVIARGNNKKTVKQKTTRWLKKHPSGRP